MHFNYMPTYCAGSCFYLYGTTPANHGIVSGLAESYAEMYCTDDASVSTVGDGTKEEGEMSPKNLLTTTITDELRMEPTLRVRSLA
jgi:hypothetical protein